jgi:hypothetical protein
MISVNIKLRPAKINDFHNNGNKYIGMVYYVIGESGKIQSYKITESTTSDHLIPFIEAGKIFVPTTTGEINNELEIIQQHESNS